ncbi:MAG: MFS transporter, partial [Calditerricola sp.]|nr:MFS transporter [Calditerricola sp.]
MFMAAVEVTIVGTAMPRIVADLGGFALLGWVFSAYLLTQAVTMPLWGKLADLYGRKPAFVVGTGLFLVGSLLCGMATSMPTLIAFRALQGLGAGAVQP